MDEELIAFFEQLTRVMESAGGATDKLSDFNKNLRKSEYDLRAAIASGIKDRKALEDAYKKDLALKKEIEKEFRKLTTEEKTELTWTQKLKKAKEEYAKLEKTEVTRKKELAREIKKYSTEVQRCEQEIEKIIKTNSGFIGSLQDASSKIDQLWGGVNKGLDLFGKFAGSSGVVGFSLEHLSSTILKYNKNLFEISRSQQVAGKGMNDLSSALKLVRDNTVMSQMEFADLSNTILKGFVGLKPSMTDIAKTLKTWGDQFGYDYDSAKDLYEVQSRFPQLYDKIEEGMKIVEKINTGSATEKEKERLEIVRNEALAFSTAGAEGSKANDLILQSLNPVLGSQKELMETEKQRRAAVKELQDLQLEFSKAFQPVLKEILKISTELLKTFNEYKGTVITVAALAGTFKLVASSIIGVNQFAKATGTSIKAAEVATKGLGKAATFALGPWGLVAAAVAATVGVFVYKNKVEKEGRQIEQDIIKDQEKKKKIHKEVNTLTKEQGEVYSELYKAQASEGMTMEEISELHTQIFNKVKNINPEIGKATKEYESINLAVTKQLELLGKIEGGIRTAVSITEEFGGRAQDALKTLTTISGLELDQSIKRLNHSLKIAMDTLKKEAPEIDIDIKGDPLVVIEKIHKKLQDMNLSEEKRLTLENLLTKAAEDAGDAKDKEGKLIRDSTSLAEVNMRQQEKMTSLAEARLETERRLMESAQWGLGASIGMMQKQVDLAYKLQKGYADTLTEVGAITKGLAKASDADLERVKSAQTAAEAEDLIRQTMGKTGKEALALTNYWAKYQELSKKAMEQQQKIYDLTKDIREGYLDAIREMAIGAGEFSKIIGTQEMGVTQLMDAVKGVSGVAKLNTMALGGLQEQVLTNKGVGTDITGQYTKQGIKFIGGETQEQRNERIYKYGESVEQTKAAIRGEVPPGAAPGVGSAVPPGAETYIAPERNDEITKQAEIQGNIIADKIVEKLPESFHKGNKLSARDAQIKRQEIDNAKKAAVEANAVNSQTTTGGIKDYTGAVNEATRTGNAPGKEDVSKIEAYKSAIKMGAGYLKKTTPPELATGGYVKTPGGNRLPLPPGLSERHKLAFGKKDAGESLGSIDKNTEKTADEVMKSTMVLSKDLRRVSSGVEQVNKSSKGILGAVDFGKGSALHSGFRKKTTMQKFEGVEGGLRAAHGMRLVPESAMEAQSRSRMEDIKGSKAKKEQEETSKKEQERQEKLEKVAVSARKKAEESASAAAQARKNFNEVYERRKSGSAGTTLGDVASAHARMTNAEQQAAKDRVGIYAKKEADKGKDAKKEAERLPQAAAKAAAKESAKASPTTAAALGRANEILGAGEGEGNATILIKLAPDLVAEIQKSSGVRVEIERASA